ncbi:hypothetical protein VTJ83DRAFT_1902 [Remersonia thermophila]|uniref:Urease accessory protein UreF n=1 Tax=Remersonia thermophila TaxID=72144 RepID=A0ABR4DH90_9PEZI
MDTPDDPLDCEIAELERKLAEAKARARRRQAQQPRQPPHPPHPTLPNYTDLPSPTAPPTPPSAANHFLLLLSDSALPLGSFAFSSGLESYLTHQKAPTTRLHHPSSSSPFSSFSTFLPLSLSSVAATSLPFVLAAHRLISIHPGRSADDGDDDGSSLLAAGLASLDDAADAAIPCTVARRASVAQGRALLSIWERAFAAGVAERQRGQQEQQPPPPPPPSRDAVEVAALKRFSALLKGAAPPGSGSGTAAAEDEADNDPPAVSAHLAPLFGAISAVLGLSAEQTAYVFLLGHTKAVVSAAVRAGVFGPYQAQRTLAGAGVQELIGAVVTREWHTPVEEAGQTVPVLDLWVGRHEVLYSRIFNS